jgi:hypothetical protein
MPRSGTDTGSAEWGLNLSGCQRYINEHCGSADLSQAASMMAYVVAFGAATSAPVSMELKRAHASPNQTSLLSGSFDVAIAIYASSSEL